MEFLTNGEVWANPTLAGDVLYAASLDHKLYVLDAATGAKKWEFDTGGIITTTPVVGDGTVYVAGLAKLFALDATSGAKKWDLKRAIGSGSDPSVVNGIVYFGVLDGSVFALDAQPANPNGTRPSRPAAPYALRLSSRAGPRISVRTTTKSTRLTSHGQSKWSYKTNGRVLASPPLPTASCTARRTTTC